MRFVDLLDDEQLSRVLSAHVGGQLRRDGEMWPKQPRRKAPAPRGCIVQVAWLCPANEGIPEFWELPIGADTLSYWFDGEYDLDWPVDLFLRKLEKLRS